MLPTCGIRGPADATQPGGGHGERIRRAFDHEHRAGAIAPSNGKGQPAMATANEVFLRHLPFRLMTFGDAEDSSLRVHFGEGELGELVPQPGHAEKRKRIQCGFRHAELLGERFPDLRMLGELTGIDLGFLAPVLRF